MRKSSGTGLVFKRYFARLIFRAVVFTIILLVYIFRRELLYEAINFKLFDNFIMIHLLWFILMTAMLRNLFPKVQISISGLKRRGDYYKEPEEGYDRLEMLNHVQKMNIGAWKVMLGWLTLNAVFAVFYLAGMIGEAELLMLTVFYYLSDTVCMVLFCPFQKFFMGNRCCVDCRIFDWGYFMMYTPMLFIKSFFSWSLFFVACIIVIRWEITYARHPERFWEGSNAAIRCKNCTDRLCRIKKPY